MCLVVRICRWKFDLKLKRGNVSHTASPFLAPTTGCSQQLKLIFSDILAGKRLPHRFPFFRSNYRVQSETKLLKLLFQNFLAGRRLPHRRPFFRTDYRVQPDTKLNFIFFFTDKSTKLLIDSPK